MKIAVVQTRPAVGSIDQNIDQHLQWINCSVRHAANLIVFPELSLTGYEPKQAAEWSLSSNDKRLRPVQAICDQHNVCVAVGCPVRTDTLPEIASLIFHPAKNCRTYSKQFLHSDETPYFRPGPVGDSIIDGPPKIALAICYELSVDAHADAAFQSGALGYIASVAKTASGVEQATKRLSQLARRHSAIVMMSNCTGLMDDAQMSGQTSAWGRRGTCLGVLDSASEGILVVDFQTESVQIVTD